MTGEQTQQKGFSRVANIFMIVAFTISAFYLITFAIATPEYRFAAILFAIIAVGGIIKRVAVLKGVLPSDRAPSPKETE